MGAAPSGIEQRLRVLEIWQAQHDAENDAAMQNYTHFKETVEANQQELIKGLAALKFRVTIMAIIAIVLVLGTNAGLAEVVKLLLR